MKAKNSLLLFAVLMISSMAFAVNGSGYYNLNTIVTYAYGGVSSETLVLSQGDAPCTSSLWSLTYNMMRFAGNGRGDIVSGFGYYSTVAGKCLGSVSDTPQNLHDLLQEQWVDNATYSDVALNLGSDIDLGEYSSTTVKGSCDENHVPLPAISGTSVLGGGFSVSHLCFVSDRPMTESVGLFSSIDQSFVQNLKISGVRIVVNGSSNGADYYPVGALAGKVNLSSINQVSLTDDSIQAPFAGGLVGFSRNSSFVNITGNDDIYITNGSKITQGYAGSKVVEEQNNSNVGYTAFLGGLVGMSIRDKDDASFSNDSIKIEVHDLAGNVSAVGGVVGLLSGKVDTLKNVHVYNKVKVDETVYSKISGGAAMGGLVGVAAPYIVYGSPAYEGGLAIENCSFRGKISGSSADSIVTIGGFVGRDSVASSSLKISNGVVDLVIQDELGSGKVSYFAGGFVGESSVCNTHREIDDYVSIFNSRASGSISVAGSSKAVGGLSSQTFVGGFAGAACLAIDGFHNDTSSVVIDVDMRTASTEKTHLDSISVGGFVGAMNTALAKELVFSNLLYNGSISVTDSLNTSYVGGVVGSFHMGEGGKAVSFKDVTVNSSEFISYESKAVAKSGASVSRNVKVGGLCGLCKEFSEISRVAILGNLNVDAAYADSLLVGGVAADFFKDDGVVMNLSGFYFEGNVNAGGNSVGVPKVGYLFGSALIYGDFNISSVYHYGEDDLDVDAFGWLSEGSDITSGWKAGHKTEGDLIQYVIRNGAKTALTPLEHNGTELAANMKKSSFAGFLNGAFDSSNKYQWSFESGSNDNLPFFVDANHAAVAPQGVTSYSVIFKDGEKLIKIVTVNEGDDAETPEDPAHEGLIFKGWDKDLSSVSSNMTVFAVYDTLKYTVSFFGPDGNLLVNQENVPYGTSVFPPDMEMYELQLVKDGYVFVGWNDSSFSSVTENLEIHPVYDLMKLTVSYVDENENPVFEKSFLYGEELVVTDSAVKAANDSVTYVFEKWTLENGEDLPATMPNKDLSIVPVFKEIRNSYTVVFLDFEGKQIKDEQVVEYGSAAVAPAHPESAGRVFTEWSDSSYLKVAGNLEVRALYDTVTFKVTYIDYNDSVYYVGTFKYNADMSVSKALERPATDAYTYTFKSWSSVENPKEVLGVLKSDMVVKAVYDSTLKTYLVTFKDFDGSVIGEVQNVGYGMAAVVPADPSREGYDFAGWTERADVVTKDMTIYARYNTAVVSSSSSEPVSSSSEPESSSSSLESSSSSFEPVELVEIVSPKVLQSGNALRLTFSADGVDETSVARIQLVGEESTILDTVLGVKAGKVTEWNMIPAPAGKFNVELTVSNRYGKDSFKDSVEVASLISVAPKSWQMISIATADMSQFRNEDASFYWWDEQHPIGEYWQYRAYAGEKVEETRGFWYGSAKGNPVLLKKSLAPRDSQIVWSLDNKFSGWNLVANPYGWYVDLSAGKTDNGVKVTFWRWNSEKSEYEIPTKLAPYEAVWANVSAATQFRMPSAPVFGTVATVAKKESVLFKSAAKASATDWTLAVSLADGEGKMDSWNVIGAGASAESLKKAPAGMGSYVRLAIAEGDSKLAKSIKSAADEYEWSLNVSAATAREASLRFDGVEKLDQLGLELSVTVDGRTQVLKKDEAVAVSLKKSAQKVTVRVAAAGERVVASGKLGGLRTLQNGSALQVGFDAADNLSGLRGHYSLVGVNGKRVASGSFTASAGSNVLNLDAPKSGLYFMQVKVGSQVANTKVMVK